MSRYTLSDLVGRLENPFNHFVVKQFDVIDGQLLDGQARHFFDACRLVGVDEALGQAPNMRETLSRVYDTFPVPYFWRRRTSIWGGLRQAIENALPV